MSNDTPDCVVLPGFSTVRRDNKQSNNCIVFVLLVFPHSSIDASRRSSSLTRL